MGTKKLDRERILAGYKEFCNCHSCEENCPYYMESELRDISCAVLYVLDRVCIDEPREKTDAKSSESGVCELLCMVRKLIDVQLGRHNGESESAFQKRKYSVLNSADELVGRVERICKEGL